MKFIKIFIATLLFNGMAIAQIEDINQQSPSEITYADTVIEANAIYTADDNNPKVEAIAILNGRFIHVGNKVDVEALIGPDTETITLDSAFVFPGFTDAHAHLSGIGQRELSLNLENVTSLAELKSMISNWRSEHPDLPVIVGRGWIETHWPEKRFPSRWDIDEVIADIPVILTRADGHALVANSAALREANITAQTDVPFGGAINQNAIGEITGMLIDNAQQLITPVMPETTADDIATFLATGSDVYSRYGWTNIHNMSVSWAEVEAIEALSDRNELNIRVYNSVDQQYANDLFQSGLRTSNNGKAITRAIKLYLDGALGSRGAALIEPYSDAQTSGLLLSTKEELMPILTQALEEGYQVNTHAIGDRANRLLLDWYEEAMATVPALGRAVEQPRWRDEHTQIVNPEDITRYQQLGVIPSMQPSHAIGDMHFAPARLGDERLNGAYAWSTLVNSGVIIAGGSDAPVERGEPLIEFYAATARRDLDGFQGENWHAEEALTRDEALKMFTLWPAIASFQEDEIGSIAIGKQADLSVFSVDLMTAIESDIPKGKAVMTMVAGEIIYRATSE
ncbi:MAG: amidohydrolase [Kordiimonas sp.]